MGPFEQYVENQRPLRPLSQNIVCRPHRCNSRPAWFLVTQLVRTSRESKLSICDPRPPTQKRALTTQLTDGFGVLLLCIKPCVRSNSRVHGCPHPSYQWGNYGRLARRDQQECHQEVDRKSEFSLAWEPLGNWWVLTDVARRDDKLVPWIRCLGS